MGFWPNDCFKDTWVLVVGGTSGIGAGIADAFVAEGARVVATGVAEHEVEEAASRKGIDAVKLDVRDKDAVERFISGFDRLDHVVNCAGIIRRGDELDADVFAQVVDINLNGSMRVAAAARPLLARQGGTLTNTASVLSFVGGGLVPGYAASKGGITQMTKSLAIAYAPEGIRVNAIAPGWIETPLTVALRADPQRNDAILARTPLKRWGKPVDLAGGVLYLASPLASYVTGTMLVIDGGYLAV